LQSLAFGRQVLGPALMSSQPVSQMSLILEAPWMSIHGGMHSFSSDFGLVSFRLCLQMVSGTTLDV
jgi:hypothetical protein